jgi:aminopeptidase N
MSVILWIVVAFRLILTGAWAGPAAPASGAENTLMPGNKYDPRMDRYDVMFYKIDLEVTDASTYLAGSASVLVQVLDNPVNELVFDLLSALSVDSVLLDGMVAEFSHAENQLIVAPVTEIGARQKVLVTVFYSGLGVQDQWISGIYSTRQDAWNKRITWTLSEPFAALNWFPCKQVLADKADSAYVFLTTDRSLKAGSNGLLENTVNLPGNRIRYEWKTRYPIAYYLISYAVADYYDYSYYVKLPGRDDSLLVQNYIYDTLPYLEQNKSDIDQTANIILLYSGLFGTYPFVSEKYGHCVAPLGGGMEHQTMTTLANFNFLLVAHELAHQWFGDYVTCGSWQDIWINEGFASYAEYVSCQNLQSQTNADLWMADAHTYVKSEADGSVYVPEAFSADEERIFDYRLSYKKGAAIIHMIRGELQNDSLFYSILRDYLDRHKNDVAIGEDFKKVVEERSGRDFTAFFNQWFYGEGYPSITVNWKHEQDTLYIYTFLTSSTTVTPAFELLTGYKITSYEGDTLIYRRHQTNYDEWKIYLPGKIESITVDPERWLLLAINGVNDISKYTADKKLDLAPNPAVNWIRIDYQDTNREIGIFVVDSAGKILFRGKTDSFPYTIDLDGYKSGSYIVLLEDENRIYSGKFIRHSR